MTTVSGSSSLDQAIKKMEDAFNEAITTNAKITTIKTRKQNLQTIASQRPSQ